MEREAAAKRSAQEKTPPKTYKRPGEEKVVNTKEGHLTKAQLLLMQKELNMKMNAQSSKQEVGPNKRTI